MSEYIEQDECISKELDYSWLLNDLSVEVRNSEHIERLKKIVDLMISRFNNNQKFNSIPGYDISVMPISKDPIVYITTFCSADMLYSVSVWYGGDGLREFTYYEIIDEHNEENVFSILSNWEVQWVLTDDMRWFIDTLYAQAFPWSSI